MQAEMAGLQGWVGKVQVHLALLIRIEASHEVALPLPMRTHHNLQGVTVMVEQMLQQEGVAVGCTVCTMDA